MRGAVLGALALALLGAVIPPAVAGTATRQVLLVTVPPMSYAEALEAPPFSSVAPHGGIGLMTTRGGVESGPVAYVTLGAGRAAAAAPGGPVPYEPSGPGVEVEVRPYLNVAGAADPGLLGSALEDAGLTSGYLDLRGTTGDPALLVAMRRDGAIPLAALNAFPTLDAPELVPGATEVVDRADLVVSPDPSSVPFFLGRSDASEVLVLLVSPGTDAAMRDRGENVTPVAVARGAPRDVLGEAGDPAGLTSDTTRRPGVVANVDVAATALAFLGAAVPDEMTGSPIRVEGAPPTDLHRRYVEYRRVVVPVGLVSLALGLGALLAALALLLGPWEPPSSVTGAVAVWGLGAIALQVALLAGSVLPSYRFPVVVAVLAVVTVGLTAIALWAGGTSATLPVAIVAGVGLALVVADALLGWPSGVTPLVGGSVLDGVRFYGLGNPYAGVVLAGVVLVAAHLRAWAGVALIAVAALFAGLPFAGADLGGGVTLFAVAALWFGLRVRGRLGWPEWVLAGLVAAGGLALLLASHLALPPPGTHVARAVEGSGDALGAVDLFVERLAANLRVTWQTPAVWGVLAGLPLGLAVAWTRPGPFRGPLQAHPAWRDAAAILALGGMIGYVLNDTFGMANIAFLYLVAALVYPALAVRWRAA